MVLPKRVCIVVPREDEFSNADLMRTVLPIVWTSLRIRLIPAGRVVGLTGSRDAERKTVIAECGCPTSEHQTSLSVRSSSGYYRSCVSKIRRYHLALGSAILIHLFNASSK